MTIFQCLLLDSVLKFINLGAFCLTLAILDVGCVIKEGLCQAKKLGHY